MSMNLHNRLEAIAMNRPTASDIMDAYYRASERSIALVGQPYTRAHHPEVDAIAAQYGLRWHVPPLPSASIHPHAMLFIVMTMPDVKVVWLPEQQRNT
jgi:hypothetical protein